MNYSPLGSSVHGISQTRILEWVTSPGDLPDLGLNLCLLLWQVDSLPLSHLGSGKMKFSNFRKTCDYVNT